jgi:hypothetical protein
MLQLLAALFLTVSAAVSTVDTTPAVSLGVKGGYYKLYLFDDHDILCSNAPLLVTQGLSAACASYVYQPTIKTKAGTFHCPWMSTSADKGSVKFWGEGNSPTDPCKELVLTLGSAGGNCRPMPYRTSFLLPEGAVSGNYILNMTMTA